VCFALVVLWSCVTGHHGGMVAPSKALFKIIDLVQHVCYVLAGVHGIDKIKVLSFVITVAPSKAMFI
jgi:uncharacterized MAPEG superfamily protein